MSSQMSNNKTPRVKLNVGGTKFETSVTSLLKFPETRLGNLAKSADFGTEELFYDRSAHLFKHILNFYRTGSMHVSSDTCMQSFSDELQFWQIDSNYLQLCCQQKHQPIAYSTECANSELCDDTLVPLICDPTTQSASLIFKDVAQHSLKDKLHSCLENPTQTVAGTIFAFLSASFIMLTIIVSILGSMPTFQKHVAPHKAFIFANCYTCAFSNSTESESQTVKVVIPQLVIIDIICAVWFTMEYILRLWAAPHLWRAFRQLLSLIDLAAIVPFYIEVTLQSLCICNETVDDFSRGMLTMRILRIMRIFRVARILRLARYSTSLRIVGLAMERSVPELSMLCTFIFISTILYSSIMYYVEDGDPDTLMVSIPEAAYWCAITLTTVGYGDITPKTIPGKLLATVVSFTGVVILAFPISIIVNKFNDAYTEFNEERRKNEETTFEGIENRKPLVATLKHKLSLRSGKSDSRKVSMMTETEVAN